MKRYLFIILVWLLLLTPAVSSNSKELSFIIIFDKKTENSYEIKEQVLGIYEDLIKNVYEDSYETLIKQNLDLFKLNDHTKVSFKNHTLTIQIGKKKKYKLKGALESRYVCSEKIKPKSFFQSLFD